MPSILSPNETFYLAISLYWVLVTFVAWSLLCVLSGYLYGYLRARPKYIILRDCDLANEPRSVDLRSGEQLSKTQFDVAENSLK